MTHRPHIFPVHQKSLNTVDWAR